MNKVFLIDEVPFFCKMFEMAIKSQNLVPYTLSNIQGSYFFIEDMAPDVLLLDLKTLLKGPWREFLREIKSGSKTRDLPVVALGFPEDFQLWSQIEAEEVEDPALLKSLFKGRLTKPLSPSLFWAELQEILK